MSSESSQAEQVNPKGVSDLMDHFVKVTEGQSTVTIGEFLDSLESRSHGAMLLFPAIIAVSPIGMIPGMSVVTGSLILLISTQMMFFSQRPWIPSRIEKFEFSRDKLEKSSRKTKAWFSKVEAVIGKRIEFLTTGFGIYPIAIICSLLALTFYPLALVPFGVFPPALAVTLFALGLTARDGLLVVLGYLITLAFSIGTWLVWPF